MRTKNKTLISMLYNLRKYKMIELEKIKPNTDLEKLCIEEINNYIDKIDKYIKYLGG